MRGCVKKGYIRKLAEQAPRNTDDCADMHSFDWNHVESLGPSVFIDGKVSDVKHKYEEKLLDHVDFSNSRAEKGFLVKATVFKSCKFDNSMWWLAGFNKCSFIDCSFNSSKFYSTRLGNKFINCSFHGIAGKGEYFSFGWGSSFVNCCFDSVQLKNIGEVIGVTFENCKLNGLITNGDFRGTRHALRMRFSGVLDMFSKEYKPVKFIDCDLTGLKTEKVMFDKDVVFKNCKKPNEFIFK